MQEYIGIKLNKLKVNQLLNKFIIPKNVNTKVLIVCIDNYSLDKKSLYYAKHIANSIKKSTLYINYQDIIVVESYPTLQITHITDQEIYKHFNMIRIDNEKHDNTVNKERRVILLNMFNDLVKDISNNFDHNITTLLLTKYLYSGEEYDDIFKNLATQTNFKYLYTYYSAYAQINNSYQIDDNYDNIVFDHLIALTKYDFDKYKISIIVDNTDTDTDTDINKSSAETFLLFPDELYMIITNNVNKDTKFKMLLYYDDKFVMMEHMSKNDVSYIELNYDASKNIDDLLAIYEIALDNQLIIPNMRENLSKMYQEHTEQTEHKYQIVYLIKKYKTVNDKETNKMMKNTNKSNNDFIQMLNEFIKISNLHVKDKNILDRINQTINKNFNKTNNDILTILQSIKRSDLQIENNTDADTDTDADADADADNVSNEFRLQESRDFFLSMLTLTDWVDELDNENTIGILLNVHTNDLARIGANGSTVNITNITSTFVPIKDYIDTILILFKNENQDDVNNIRGICGNIIGQGNTALPIFICEQHWKLARIHLEYLLGIALVNNPFGYVDSHLNFMFCVLTEMGRQIFRNINNKDIKMYIAMFRTCAQIAYEKGYHKGIKKMITNLTNDGGKMSTIRPFGADCIFGQIIATGATIDENLLNKLCDKIYENIFWSTCVKYIKYEKFEQEENYTGNIISFVEKLMTTNIEIIMSNFLMIKIFKTVIVANNGFKKFLNKIDKYYSNLDDENVELFVKLLKDKANYKISGESLYELIQMNYKEKTEKYVKNSVMYNKMKLRKCF